MYLNFNLSLIKQFRYYILTAIVCLLIIIYFSPYSLYQNKQKLAAELQEQHQTLDSLRAERMRIKHSAKLLSPSSLDRDMVEEKIRHVLGVAGKKEKFFQKDIDPEQDHSKNKSNKK